MPSIWDNYNELPTGSQYQIGLGAGQVLTGALIPKGKRSKYRIPGAISEATGIEKQQAFQTVRPGNEYAISQIKEREGRGANTLQRNLTSSSQILAGYGQIDRNSTGALSDNANQNTLFKFNASQNLQSSLARLAQYQDKAWYENQLKPYMDRVTTKNMLTGAGIQNISGALNTKSEMDMYEKVFGKSNQDNGWDENKAFDDAVNNYQFPPRYSFSGYTPRNRFGGIRTGFN